MSQRGFTYIEMVFMVVLISILAISAVPLFLDTGTFRTVESLNDVRSSVSYAQMQAMLTQTKTRVTFDTTNEDVELEYDTGTGWAAMTHPSTHGDFTVDLDSGDYTGVQIVSASIGGSNVLIFDTDGTPMNGSSVALTADGTVTFTGSRTLTITPETGNLALS